MCTATNPLCVLYTGKNFIIAMKLLWGFGEL